eukprot:451461-Prorocentrum_minimum.AAC.4
MVTGTTNTICQHSLWFLYHWQLRNQGLLESPRHTQYINQYLNQFFCSRISSELLVSQHLALHQAVHDPESRFARDNTYAPLRPFRSHPVRAITLVCALKLCHQQSGSDVLLQAPAWSQSIRLVAARRIDCEMRWSPVGSTARCGGRPSDRLRGAEVARRIDCEVRWSHVGSTAR